MDFFLQVCDLVSELFQGVFLVVNMLIMVMMAERATLLLIFSGDIDNSCLFGAVGVAVVVHFFMRWLFLHFLLDVDLGGVSLAVSAVVVVSVARHNGGWLWLLGLSWLNNLLFFFLIFLGWGLVVMAHVARLGVLVAVHGEAWFLVLAEHWLV